MQAENEIWQYAEIEQISPEDLDILLADGWRHFGAFFFRDMMGWNNGQLCQITPLRINLAKFQFSKNQRKLLRQNKETKIVFREAFIDERKEEIFYKHIERFSSNKPESIYTFLSENPAKVPGNTFEISLYDENDILYAVSFIDLAYDSLSSIYAMFDPDYAHRSPGTHTLLAEIQYGLNNQKKYLYTGYAYRENSHYDYKKRFSGSEYYDWQGNWLDLDF